MSKLKTTPWAFEDGLETMDDFKAAIEIALEDNDPEYLASVLGVLAKKQGMTKVSKRSGLARSVLYKALQRGGNPEVSTLLKVLPALGLRLKVEQAEMTAA